ncbi:hypothetical protein CLIB1444_02S02938 [[Candida] jaroonii]|uniref:Uncharacterized protein n=1 Tax=[Candida] jaroonii TaxID=467808 RepID=A0ACA9Y482_9ASCO|nr:hypothetical protein CLIB1444_02S02938 [[Candida] jaroonii]
MTSYLSQLIPRLSLNGGSNKYIQTEQAKTPKLQYITIFNPSYVNAKDETNEELMKQIISFISTNDGDELESNKVEQLRIIGLIQAIEGLSGTFDESKDTNIIKSTKSSIIVKRLEGDFILACSISMPENGIKESSINHQMIQLISQSYDFFKILNTSFQNILDNYNRDILKNLIQEHWGGFLVNFNSENFKFPPTVKWPNSLNYRGFLGFFGSYKKSSVEFNYNSKVEIDEFCQTQSVPMHGIIISYFDKLLPKKYGLVYSNNLFDDTIQDYPISEESLIKIYNLIEYYEYHEKLNTEQFTKLSNDDLFSSPKIMKDTINVEIEEEDEEAGFFANTTNTAMDILNPINITNNLVISPINYTMNSMKQLSDTSNWLKIPSYLKFGVVEEAPELEQSDDEDEGEFIVGLLDEIIYRKLIYLDTLTKDGSEEREYSLVIYSYKQMFVTLIYDSSTPELDNKEFYQNLRSELLPILNELDTTIINGGSLIASTSSLPRSVNGLISNDTIENQLDSEFFFVIYDKNENNFKSSLPYLPLPLNSLSELNQYDKAHLNIRSAMFYLHDQLLDIFFLQNEGKLFLKENSIKEYFHKFSTNKINDWMFYYISMGEKFIIIIKNSNHNKRKKTKKVNATTISTSSISMENDLKLSILENLGDDVKLWFETFQMNGDT